MGALGNGYGGGVPLSFAYGGHGDATSAAAYTAALQAAARSSSLSQGFHPYRRWLVDSAMEASPFDDPQNVPQIDPYSNM